MPELGSLGLRCLNDHCEVGLTGVFVDLSGVVCDKNRLTNSSLACPGASCAAGIKKGRKPFPYKRKRLRPFKSKTSGELQQTELLGDRRESGVLLHEPFSTRAYPIMLVPLPEKTPEVLYPIVYACDS
jgi:hypothetical protein